jgi:hypothetical protein
MLYMEKGVNLHYQGLFMIKILTPIEEHYPSIQILKSKYGLMSLEELMRELSSSEQIFSRLRTRRLIWKEGTKTLRNSFS